MSKVYFTDFTAKFGDSILSKFDRFLSASELDKIDFKDKLVAIKIHFGELGNLAFLRHQYARVLVDHIKKRGGKVFLTDANTLYPGFRGNAVDQACVDAINKAPLNPKGKAAKKMEAGAVSIHDVFIAAHPNTDYRAALIHGENIGLGSREYELETF